MATVTFTCCDGCNPSALIYPRARNDRAKSCAAGKVPFVLGCESEAVQLHSFVRRRIDTFDKVFCKGCTAEHEIRLALDEVEEV